MPGENLRFPYLTTSDLLEEYLIRVPYAVNSECFVTGTDGECPFLLPVKPLFPIEVRASAADDIPLSSDVSAVTLYPQGATITREIPFEAPAGQHELILTDLENTLAGGFIDKTNLAPRPGS